MDMSAIDYAIYYKFPEAAMAMVTHDTRAQEVMALKSVKHPCVILALIASMPRVFEAVQDKCITKANCKKDSKSFYVSTHHKLGSRTKPDVDSFWSVAYFLRISRGSNRRVLKTVCSCKTATAAPRRIIACFFSDSIQFLLSAMSTAVRKHGRAYWGGDERYETDSSPCSEREFETRRN